MPSKGGMTTGDAAKAQAAADCSLGRVNGYRVQGGVARFRVEAGEWSARVELSVCAPGVVRYRLTPEGADGANGFDLLSPEWKPSASTMSASRRGKVVLLEALGVTVEVHREPWQVVVKDATGAAVLSERPEDLDARGNHLSPPSGFTVESGQPSRCRVTFDLDPYERLFGLGEKGTGVDRRGQRIVCWNRNAYGSGTELAYKNIPFLVSTRGYGLFLNNTRRSTWDLGARSSFASTIEVDGPGFDVFIILGGTLKEILGKYAELTGHAPLPPRWSFGLWISPGWGKHLLPRGMDQERVLELADELRQRRLPSDVIHLDPYWMGDSGYCAFQWGKERFPDPKHMVSELRRRGFRVCLWEHPYIDKRTEMYREGDQKGYFIKRADGSVYDVDLVMKSIAERRGHDERFYDPGGIVDFSNPEAYECYKSKHRPLLEAGVATFKTDFGEEIPEDGRFANGKTGAEMHNAFPLLYNRAVFEVMSEFTDRPVLWGRSAYAGIQRTPVQWSGDPLADFPSLATTIRAGLSYGMSGVPFWTFDLGGFKGEPTREAYVRWVQTGLLISHSRFHGTAQRLPWMFGAQVFRIVQKYVQLRYHLLPYIYGVAHEATTAGAPVMRPLALEFQDDQGSLASDYQYMLGPYLLVAPVLNPEGRVDVYLPPGAWYDLWTGEKVAGPTTRKMKVGLDVLPIYIRSNAILPMVEASETVADFWDPLTVEIYPDASGVLHVPEEDGRPATRIEVAAGEPMRLQASGPARSWRLMFKDVDEPKWVRFVKGKGVHRYNGASRTLEAQVSECAELEISIER